MKKYFLFEPWRLLSDIIPGKNTVSGKASVASANRARGPEEHSEPLRGGFSMQSPLRKFLVIKEHLDWLKIDLNAAKIITVQYYKHSKN